MLIIGSTVRKRPAGFAADYCTVCREAAVMRVHEHRRVWTVYFVPVTAGRPFELWAACPTCTTRFLRPVGHYATFLTATGPLDLAAERTNPRLAEEIRVRDAWEEVLLEGETDPQLRLTAIDEVIRSLEADAIRRQVSGWYESATTLIAAGAIVLTAAAAITTVTAPALAWPCGVAAAPFWAWLVYRMVRGQTRARARMVEGRIARALLYLDPTDEELRIVRGTLAKAGSSVAKGLDLGRLRRLIDAELDVARAEGAGDRG
jgi:hypothetical protein